MRCRALRQLVVCPLVLVIPIASSACTANLWFWAVNSPVARYNDPSVGFSQNGFGPKPVLVFRYADLLGPMPDPVLTIPLDSSGRPEAPFAYTGHARTAAEFWRSVSQRQRMRIRQAAHLTQENGVKSSLLDSQDSPSTRSESSSKPRLDTSADFNAFVAFAYRPGSPYPAAVPVFSGASGQSPPSHAMIVIVPQFVLEDDPDLPRRVGVAVAATPLTLATDAVLVGTSPLWIPMLISISAPLGPPSAPVRPAESHASTARSAASTQSAVAVDLNS